MSTVHPYTSHGSLPASLDSIKGLIRLVTIIANYRWIYKKNNR